jgi:protein-disulfide isomerase
MTTDLPIMRPVLTLPVGQRDHVQGPATALVTLVEYGDYQCPHCLHAHEIMPDIQKRVGDRMRLIFRNFPLTTAHPDAQRAAEAAEAAGAQGKFWQMHDALFDHQSRLEIESLLQYAADIGLDVARFSNDLETHAFARRVHEDFVSGVRSGVNGTPTFFIDGLRHDDAWDVETLSEAILAEAAGL